MKRGTKAQAKVSRRARRLREAAVLLVAFACLGITISMPRGCGGGGPVDGLLAGCAIYGGIAKVISRGDSRTFARCKDGKYVRVGSETTYAIEPACAFDWETVSGYTPEGAEIMQTVSVGPEAAQQCNGYCLKRGGVYRACGDIFRTFAEAKLAYDDADGDGKPSPTEIETTGRVEISSWCQRKTTCHCNDDATPPGPGEWLTVQLCMSCPAVDENCPYVVDVIPPEPAAPEAPAAEPPPAGEPT